MIDGKTLPLRTDVPENDLETFENKLLILSISIGLSCCMIRILILCHRILLS